MLEFPQQGIAPAPLIDAVADMAVEIAIGAFRLAERPMHIDAEAAIVGGFLG
jgi:hypothetical protein